MRSCRQRFLLRARSWFFFIYKTFSIVSPPVLGMCTNISCLVFDVPPVQPVVSDQTPTPGVRSAGVQSLG
jgi:hypothetical protein